MKIKAIVFGLAFFSICPFCANSQDTTKTSLEYSNQFLGGMITGRNHSGPGAIFEMSNGVRVRRLQAGLLTGLTVYQNWQLMPIGADISYALLKFRGNALFLRLDGARDVAGRPVYSDVLNGTPSLNRAWDYGIGAGYRWAAGKFSLYLTGEYRYQELRYSLTNLMYYPYLYYDVAGPYINLMPPTTSYNKSYNRWVVRLGFGLH